jgi:hypothetical protein
MFPFQILKNMFTQRKVITRKYMKSYVKKYAVAGIS